MRGATMTVFAEAALVMSMICNVLIFIPFIGTSWAVPRDREIDTNFEGIGLWRYCTKTADGGGVCHDLVSMNGVPGWFKAVQAMMTLSFITFIIAFLTIIAFTCCQKFQENTAVNVAFIIQQAVAILFGMVGLIIFGSKLEETFVPLEGNLKIDWCFDLASSGVGLSFIPLTLAIVQGVRMPKQMKGASRFENGPDLSTVENSTGFENPNLQATISMEETRNESTS